MPVPGKKHAGILFGLLLLLFICLGIGLVKSVSAIDDIDKSLRQIKALTAILATIQSEYVDPSMTKTEDLINGAIHGMVNSLDKYSTYMEKDEAKEFNDITQGSFGGLGIQIDVADGWLTVIEPLPNTPAANAGLMSGDRIVEIDGQSTKNMQVYDAIKKLKGEPNTSVTISIARRGEKELMEKKLTRAIIKTSAVQKNEIKMLDKTIGYVRLRDFTRDAAEEMESAIKDLQKQGMKGLIFDLRDNVGGLLDVAVKISELFIEKEKVVVSYKGKNSQEKIYKSNREPLGAFPLAVLVNEFSASASEIVAGCLQDYHRGIIVGPLGRRTFGKGSVQTLIELDVLEGACLKLTTAKYYTPSGRSISDDKGLKPDVAAQVTDDQRIQIRRDGKSGYIPPELLGIEPPKEKDKDKEKDKEKEKEKGKEIKTDSARHVTVDEAFKPADDPTKKETIYDIELFTAYQCLKSIEVLQSGSIGHNSLATPRN